MSAASGKRKLSGRGLTGLALVIAALAAMAAVAALPFVWYSASSAELADSRNALRLLEAKLKNATRGERPPLVVSDDIAPMFVSGTTPGLALAELQRLAGKLAQDNGMVVERTQLLPTENSGGLAVLRMEIETSGSLADLRGYLLAIETGEPLILIKEATIGVPAAAGDAGAALPSDHLSVALQVEAYGWWEALP